ncbi:serine hydrolase domain-containing protein [Zavarzinella formosa]|uniref:serine hydrolase domain-containing protein n=1 Tax=Zavarzinella formosa TaxID=360055 RepID=UPI0002ED6005|nr:serine hydrolase domain-containing protein [Zavarzinella formosa]
MNYRWLPLVLCFVAPAWSQEAPKNVASVLQPYVDQHKLAGAVTLVADKEKILSVETVGFANIAAKSPMSKDSLFWIASMSKPITAVGLMMLVDEGKVKLDEPASKYLPELKDVWVAAEKDNDHVLLKRPKNVMTVRMLLTHVSGMPFVSALEQPTLDMVTLKDGVRSYAMTPLHAEPGTKFQYSNAGINTAGRIIEVVSGMPYEEFMEKRLFGPLGMKDTTFTPNEEQLKRLATSYKPNAKKDDLEETPIWALTYPLTGKKRLPMPAGGLFSTASDLAAFCQMMLNGGEWKGVKYLTPESVKEMTKRQTPETMKESWGLGFTVGPNTYGHGGAFATQMNVDTNRNLVTIFLVQHSGFPGDGGKTHDVFRQTAAVLYGKK